MPPSKTTSNKSNEASSSKNVSLRGRIFELLNTVKWSVRAVYYLAVCATITFAIPLFFISLNIYTPLSLLVIVLAFAAIYYLHSKRSTVDDVIERVEQVTTSNTNSTNDETKKTNIIQRAVTTVVDTGISSATEAAMLLPMGMAVVGVIAALFKYTSIGVALVIVAVLLLAIISCCCAGVKTLSHVIVDRYLGSEIKTSGTRDDETTPLIRQ